LPSAILLSVFQSSFILPRSTVLESCDEDCSTECHSAECHSAKCHSVWVLWREIK
jgi:hypothetical protein